jgi:hypothetical protein
MRITRITWLIDTGSEQKPTARQYEYVKGPSGSKLGYVTTGSFNHINHSFHRDFLT